VHYLSSVGLKDDELIQRSNGQFLEITSLENVCEDDAFYKYDAELIDGTVLIS
jgi:hypothetical protein